MIMDREKYDLSSLQCCVRDTSTHKKLNCDSSAASERKKNSIPTAEELFWIHSQNMWSPKFISRMSLFIPSSPSTRLLPISYQNISLISSPHSLERPHHTFETPRSLFGDRRIIGFISCGVSVYKSSYRSCFEGGFRSIMT